MSAPLRIGDAERERAQAALSEHYAAGRLDHDEYSERLDRIWAARTRQELDPVFADLPVPGQHRPAGQVRPRPRPTGSRLAGLPLPAPLLVLLAVVAAVVVASSWPLILIALGVWFCFFRGACRPHRRW